MNGNTLTTVVAPPQPISSTDFGRTPTPRPALKATGVRRRDARCPETELAAITAERDLLCRCLRGLVDEQNGAPLELRRKQWQAAMDEALAALDATEAAA